MFIQDERLKRCHLLVALLLAAGCGSSNTGSTVETVPAPVPETGAASTVPAAEQALGIVRVTAAALNVRRDPAATAEVVAQAKKGDRMTLLAATGDWSKVRMADGTTGWVASRLVTREGGAPPAAAAGKRRRGSCPPDSDFRFITPPKPNFADSQQHGLVAVDVNVDSSGRILSTKVISNSTGDEALAALAVREIRSASFAAPVRNCAPKAFIYTYKRSF